MTRHIVFHSDSDGMCSGAIIYDWAQSQTKKETILHPINYNDKFPLDQIGRVDEVYIVDFSIDTDVMDKLLEITPDVTWIDHHKTAIAKYEGYQNMGLIKGIQSNEEAGCVLTWGHFYPNVVIPMAVLLIGDRDIWRYTYGDDTRHFNMGLLMHDINPIAPIWRQLFGDSGKSLTLDIQKDGRIAIKFRDAWAKVYTEAWGWEAEFEGIKCFVMNLGKCGSEYFGGKIKEYDICSAVAFNGVEWIVSLYSEKIDVSGLAVKHRGGGHKGASGFQCKELPFRKISG